ncbi:Uncharacterised protein [Neisseria zoodegmatis]|uniref:Type VI secretion system (T6SS), amidase effector protein 4 n=1 Tax=Neisseria zoodegmatis TaxID=326523 RepID=A0A378WH44_9NEIS|nr:type VI secretion system amidase effector protein Tae4 [Neisseria zoodegmatis]SUA36786.1 Uncharacterised protein [Neisseria zoodegmatis]
MAKTTPAKATSAKPAKPVKPVKLAKPKPPTGSTARPRVSPKKPAWADMVEHYKTIPSHEFYPLISKRWAELAEREPTVWENTCAARMSYALNHSGIRLPANRAGAFIGDKDKKNHWFRVRELGEFLKKQFGKGTVEYRPPRLKSDDDADFDSAAFQERIAAVKQNVLAKIKGKTGIVMFEVEGWGNASGHFTLWDGSKMLYARGHESDDDSEYYFWFARLSPNPNRPIQTVKVIFWELI